MYESRTYDDKNGEPVVVLVVTGQHDVSRFVHTMNGAPPVVEQIGTGLKIVRQLKRHNFGRAALTLLAAHGGTDFTDEQSPTEPAALGEWLRKWPENTIFLGHIGASAWQLGVGIESGAGDDREFPALIPVLSADPFEVTERHVHLGFLAEFAPFTVLHVGDPDYLATGPEFPFADVVDELEVGDDAA